MGRRSGSRSSRKRKKEEQLVPQVAVDLETLPAPELTAEDIDRMWEDKLQKVWDADQWAEKRLAKDRERKQLQEQREQRRRGIQEKKRRERREQANDKLTERRLKQARLKNPKMRTVHDKRFAIVGQSFRVVRDQEGERVGYQAIHGFTEKQKSQLFKHTVEKTLVTIPPSVQTVEGKQECESSMSQQGCEDTSLQVNSVDGQAGVTSEDQSQSVSIKSEK